MNYVLDVRLKIFKIIVLSLNEVIELERKNNYSILKSNNDIVKLKDSNS